MTNRQYPTNDFRPIESLEALAEDLQVVQDQARGRFLAEEEDASGSPAHGLKVGDILVSSWGYEQTNIDFYEVVKVTPKGVGIVKIEKKTIGPTDGPSIKVVPVPGTGKGGKVLTKRPRPNGYVSITSYSSAQKWDGQPEHETGASYGH